MRITVAFPRSTGGTAPDICEAYCTANPGTSPVDKMIIFVTGYADSIIKGNQAFIDAGGNSSKLSSRS